jgi:hypothetical protein
MLFSGHTAHWLESWPEYPAWHTHSESCNKGIVKTNVNACELNKSIVHVHLMSIRTDALSNHAGR